MNIIECPICGKGWRDAEEKPQPSKPGVLCDKFIVCDLSKTEWVAYYFYDEDRWTINGDDTLKILKWYRVPPAFA